MKLLLFLLPAVVYCDIIEDLTNLPTSDPPSCYKEYFRMATCIEPHQEIIQIIFSTLEKNETEIYNPGLANKALQIGRNISECLGRNFTCEIPKMVVYSLDNFDYIGRKIYGDAFHCFINAKVFEKLNSCHPSYKKVLDTLVDADSRKNFTSGVLDCIAQEIYEYPSCTIDRIVDLYHAGVAFEDAFSEFIKREEKLPVEWNFDAEKYCDN